MRINKLTASFGTLDNETLSFHDGLNIAEVPENKGTQWCDFVGAMLYGVEDGDELRSDGEFCITPVSGAPMEGLMELTAEGCDISLSRTTAVKDAPMREFSAVYTGTARAVEKMDEKNAGEMLTGVKRQIFERCAVMSASDGDRPTAERIITLSKSGEEGVSYDSADDTLRQWQRDRRYMRRGALPELESKIGQVQRELADIEKTSADAEALEQSLETERRRCAALESAVNESRRHQRREALDKLSTGRSSLKACSQAHDASLGALTSAKEQLRKSRFGSRSPEELEREINADLARLDALRVSGEKKASPVLGALCFLLAVVSAALYTAYHQTYYVIAAVVFCLAATALIMRCTKLKNAAASALAGRKEILERYSAQTDDDLPLFLEAHKALWEEVVRAELNEQSSRGEYEAALAAQQALESSALGELDFSSGSSEAAKLSRELNEARAECERISSKLSLLRGRIAAAGDPLVLGSTLSVLKNEYGIISDEYDAIELAAATLHDADTVMKNEISPELGALAYRYMTVACDGVQPLLTDGTEAVTPPNVSEALAYLSIRLAVCEEAMPAGESLPLLLAGVISDMDETTAAHAIELLKEIAAKRQVILFK
ncbi:MAG: hypothetical protein Q4E35_05600 [Eubacteriales bacterium]|nr:hypothetical protein [Eubacteriales bacterium]